jgi:uncharacterized protein YndB with AHSA1/START domain
MWAASAETTTRAAPEAVWALWQDPQRWKDWNEQIAEADLRGPFAVGTRARVRFRRRPWPITFTITSLEPGRRFTDEARLPGVRLGHEHAIEHDGPTTTIRHRLYFDGPAEKIYALLMGRQMRAAVRQFGERERDLAERG